MDLSIVNQLPLQGSCAPGSNLPPRPGTFASLGQLQCRMVLDYCVTVATATNHWLEIEVENGCWFLILAGTIIHKGGLLGIVDFRDRRQESTHHVVVLPSDIISSWSCQLHQGGSDCTLDSQPIHPCCGRLWVIVDLYRPPLLTMGFSNAIIKQTSQIVADHRFLVKPLNWTTNYCNQPTTEIKPNCFTAQIGLRQTCSRMYTEANPWMTWWKWQEHVICFPGQTPCSLFYPSYRALFSASPKSTAKKWSQLHQWKIRDPAWSISPGSHGRHGNQWKSSEQFPGSVL